MKRPFFATRTIPKRNLVVKVLIKEDFKILRNRWMNKSKICLAADITSIIVMTLSSELRLH